MGIFMSKPTYIEAYQLPLEGETCSDEMIEFLGDRDMDNLGNGVLTIYRTDGMQFVYPTNWIIKNEDDSLTIATDKELRELFIELSPR